MFFDFLLTPQMLSLKTVRLRATLCIQTHMQAFRHKTTCAEFRTQADTDITMHTPWNNEYWDLKLRDICSMAFCLLTVLPTSTPHETFTETPSSRSPSSSNVQSIKWCWISFRGSVKQWNQGSKIKPGCLCKNAMCVIPSLTKVSWKKNVRHCALWMSQESHPGIGVLHARYTPDNNEWQNGVWGRQPTLRTNNTTPLASGAFLLLTGATMSLNIRPDKHSKSPQQSWVWRGSAFVCLLSWSKRGGRECGKRNDWETDYKRIVDTGSNMCKQNKSTVRQTKNRGLGKVQGGAFCNSKGCLRLRELSG